MIQGGNFLTECISRALASITHKHKTPFELEASAYTEGMGNYFSDIRSGYCDTCIPGRMPKNCPLEGLPYEAVYCVDWGADETKGFLNCSESILDLQGH